VKNKMEETIKKTLKDLFKEEIEEELKKYEKLLEEAQISRKDWKHRLKIQRQIYDRKKKAYIVYDGDYIKHKKKTKTLNSSVAKKINEIAPLSV
jgi:hypothetical protein